MPEDNLPTTTSTSPAWLKPILIVGLIGLVIVCIYFWQTGFFSIEQLADREVFLKQQLHESPVVVYSLAFLLYVAVAGVSLPIVTLMSLIYAWFFGFWPALVLISFASTSGATIAFLTSRFLFRDVIQKRFGDWLVLVNRNLKREGSFYLFTLRLIPLVPFFVLNPVMGLTPMRTKTYWWVSQLGMLPGTIVYVFAGSSVPDLETLSRKGASSILTPQIWIAFVLLAIFPFLVRKIIQRVRGPKLVTPKNSVHDGT